MKKRFIFDTDYNKKQSKKDTLKYLIWGSCGLVAIILIIVVILASMNRNKNKEAFYEVKSELIIEAGSILPEVSDYFKTLENIKIEDIKLEYPFEFELSYDTSSCSSEDLEKLTNKEVLESDLACAKQNLITPATYGVIVLIDHHEYTVNLIVEDNSAPILLTKDVEIYQNETYKIDDFVSLCFDINGECKLSFNNSSDASIKTPGEYEIGITAEDKYGNKTDVVNAKLVIKEANNQIFTVTFNASGGTSVSPVRVEKDGVINEPKTTRSGYEFLGWYLGNNKFDFNTKITSNITLVAKWEKVGGEGPDVPTVIPVTSVSLDFKKIYLGLGDTKTVTATVRPSNATNKNVAWKSSNEAVASVVNGRITGIKEGTAIITATSGGKSSSVEVVVRNNNTTCKYGDTNYDHNYIISANLTENNCAVDPNRTYNENVSIADYNKLFNTISSLGYKIVENGYHANYYKVRNNAGTGVVGYQITVSVEVVDGNNKRMSATYIINSNGTRKFLSNTISGLK